MDKWTHAYEDDVLPFSTTMSSHGLSTDARPRPCFRQPIAALVSAWIRSNPGVGPAVQLPKLLFLPHRRFNRPQPVRGRPGLSPPPLFMRSKEMCENTVVNGFVMNTESDCSAITLGDKSYSTSPAI